MDETKDDINLIKNEKVITEDEEHSKGKDCLNVDNDSLEEHNNGEKPNTDDKIKEEYLTEKTESSEIVANEEDKEEVLNESKEKTANDEEQGASSAPEPPMEELDLRSANFKDAKITFDFEVTVTGLNLQPTFSDIPEDMKQPILMMEYGKSVPSLLPERINLDESVILTGKRPLETIEELRELYDRLLDTPIYSIVTAFYKRRKPKNQSRYWKATLEVLVNTTHPAVQAPLKSYLDEAIRLMERGSKFCMKISFSEVLQQIVARIAEPFDHEFGKGCNVYFDMYVTNYGRKSELCYSPRFIGCCFLCWMFAGPCYMIHRCIAVKDIERSFSGLPVVFVNQRGEYEILSMNVPAVHPNYKF